MGPLNKKPESVLNSIGLSSLSNNLLVFHIAPGKRAE